MNTYTNGAVMDASSLNTNFSTLKTAVESIPNWKSNGKSAYYTDGKGILLVEQINPRKILKAIQEIKHYTIMKKLSAPICRLDSRPLSGVETQHLPSLRGHKATQKIPPDAVSANLAGSLLPPAERLSQKAAG